MKKTLSIIALLAVFILYGCVEDEGNYDYAELPTFTIDTTSVQTSFTVQQFSKLTIPSHLNYTGDKSNLSYTWSIYEAGYSQSTITADTLASTENLDEEIRQSPGNYIVEFCALNTATGLRAMMTYNVTIESVVGAGLLVFYGNNNGTCDLDIVKSPLFDSSFSEDVINHKSFSLSNPDYQLKGNPVNLWHERGYYIVLVTDQDAVKTSEDDMTLVQKFYEMFYGNPPVCKPQSIDAAGLEILFNNGKVHTAIPSWSVGTPCFGSERVGDYENAAPFSAVANGGGMLAYDQNFKYFLTGGYWTSTLDKIDVKGEAFDFGNIGKELIYMNNGYGSISNTSSYAQGQYLIYCIFQDPGDVAHRYLYVADISQSSYSAYKAQAAIDLSECPDMSNAQFFAFGRRGPVVYYATSHSIYQLHYSIDSNSASGADKIWSTDETITMVKMFNDSRTVNDLDIQSKYLMVSTYNETTHEGTLRIFQVDIVSGAFTVEPVKTFRGFGKIKDVFYKG